MKALDLLRGEREAVEAKRDAAIEAMESVATAALSEERSLSPEDSAEIEARQAEIVAIDAELSALDEREAELVLIEERTAARAARPSLQVISSPAPADVMTDRSATPQQLADAVTACRLVDHDVFDPRLQPGGDAVEDEGEAAHDAALEASDEQHRLGVVGDEAQLVERGRRRRRQLGQQVRQRVAQLVGGLGCDLDLHAHPAHVTGPGRSDPARPRCGA